MREKMTEAQRGFLAGLTNEYGSLLVGTQGARRKQDPVYLNIRTRVSQNTEVRLLGCGANWIVVDCGQEGKAVPTAINIKEIIWIQVSGKR